MSVRHVDRADRFPDADGGCAWRVLDSREREVRAVRPAFGLEAERTEAVAEFFVQRAQRLQSLFQTDPDDPWRAVRWEHAAISERYVERSNRD